MEWIYLNSSLLRAVRYHDQASHLEAEFCDGSVYRYLQVPADTFESLLEAESKGVYFNHQIRKRFQSAKTQPAGAARGGASSQDEGRVHA